MLQKGSQQFFVRMVGSIGVLGKHSYLMERVFATKEYNPQGVYGLQLCIYGEWTDIIVDDRLPCFPDNTISFTKVCLVIKILLNYVRLEYCKMLVDIHFKYTVNLTKCDAGY